METEILDIDYSESISILGTAHFTRRSFIEALEAVRELKPTDLAIELDLQRFQMLNQRCTDCPERLSCTGRCEFVGATEALGNIDANIWLIDMSEREIAARIRQLLPPTRLWWFSYARFPFPNRSIDEVRLWESGYKEEVMDRHARRLEVLRKRDPHVWQVLIDERNALMAARLAWIATKRLKEGENLKVLALTGAAHVEGIRRLLSSPTKIREELGRLDLRFTAPTLIKRVTVN